ncbi:MAG TPA: ATP-binding cassette domain-containing protein, partial [Burkholderiales bacterium]|nr:ATP-binding cassette domain-containing protein [Burkholderiales bacterium]
VGSELDRVATACRLEAVFDREIYKLSKGYRQRLGLAQALLGKPEVLLLDEPTAGLDPGQIQETREVIRSFGEHHAVLLSTHILPEVTLICGRVAIISQGRLLAIDSPDGLQRASEQTNRVTLTAAAPAEALRAELLSLAGVVAVAIQEVPGNARLLNVECQTDAREGVEAAIARAVAGRWDLHRLERRQPTLENVFLRYVSQAPAEARLQ